MKKVKAPRKHKHTNDWIGRRDSFTQKDKPDEGHKRGRLAHTTEGELAHDQKDEWCGK